MKKLWKQFIIRIKATRTTNRERIVAHAQLKSKKAWEVAKSPVGGIFMTGIMLWLSGSAVNIFSISITMYSMINPIKALFGVSAGW